MSIVSKDASHLHLPRTLLQPLFRRRFRLPSVPYPQLRARSLVRALPRPVPVLRPCRDTHRDPQVCVKVVCAAGCEYHQRTTRPTPSTYGVLRTSTVPQHVHDLPVEVHRDPVCVRTVRRTRLRTTRLCQPLEPLFVESSRSVNRRGWPCRIRSSESVAF